MTQTFAPGLFGWCGGGEERPLVYGTWFDYGDGARGCGDGFGEGYGSSYSGDGYGPSYSGDGVSKSTVEHRHMCILEITET